MCNLFLHRSLVNHTSLPHDPYNSTPQQTLEHPTLPRNTPLDPATNPTSPILQSSAYVLPNNGFFNKAISMTSVSTSSTTKVIGSSYLRFVFHLRLPSLGQINPISTINPPIKTYIPFSSSTSSLQSEH